MRALHVDPLADPPLVLANPQIIASQQQALQHVTKVLKEDLEAMEVMRSGLGLIKGKAEGRP